VGAAELVNRLSLIGAAGGRDLARIGTLEFGAATLLAALAAVLAAAASAQRAASVDPAEGMRDD
jgi:putative ABC transport system permease protein